MEPSNISKPISSISVLGTFNSQPEIKRVISALKSLKLRNTDMSITMTSKIQREKFLYKNPSNGVEGAIVGACSGATFGGILGYLLSAKLLVLPGLMQLATLGPLAATVGWASFGGAFGCIAGTLVGFGIPKYNSIKSDRNVKSEKILFTAQVENTNIATRAKKILLNCGGENVIISSPQKGRA